MQKRSKPSAELVPASSDADEEEGQSWGRWEGSCIPLVGAAEEQRRVPWGGNKIDWAPPKLGFIVGVERPTSYGGV